MKPTQAVAGTPGSNPVQIVLAIVTVLTLAGSVLAIVTLASSYDVAIPTRSPGESSSIGEPSRTSFGVVVVQHVEKTNGLTSKDLAGMTHGIQNLVPPNKAQIETSVTLSNTTDHTVAYSPRQFRLIAGDKVVKPKSANIEAGVLQPQASIDALIQFVIPRNGAALRLSFFDQDVDRTVVMDLGRVNVAPEGTTGFNHDGHSK